MDGGAVIAPRPPARPNRYQLGRFERISHNSFPQPACSTSKSDMAKRYRDGAMQYSLIKSSTSTSARVRADFRSIADATSRFNALKARPDPSADPRLHLTLLGHSTDALDHPVDHHRWGRKDTQLSDLLKILHLDDSGPDALSGNYRLDNLLRLFTGSAARSTNFDKYIRPLYS